MMEQEWRFGAIWGPFWGPLCPFGVILGRFVPIWGHFGSVCPYLG